MKVHRAKDKHDIKMYKEVYNFKSFIKFILKDNVICIFMKGTFSIISIALWDVSREDHQQQMSSLYYQTYYW